MSITISRQGEHYAPLAFTRELKLIDPELSPFWDNSCERWLIISSGHPDVFGRKKVEVEFAVSKGKAYTPLDGRILSEVRECIYLRDKLINIDKHLKEMKESDEEMPIEAEKEWQGLKREFMKKLYMFENTKTFT